MRDENRGYITGAGPVIWLTASVDTLLDRLHRDASNEQRRPRLTDMNERAEMKSILAARLPIYQRCATVEVDTEGKSVAEISAEIVVHLQRGD